MPVGKTENADTESFHCCGLCSFASRSQNQFGVEKEGTGLFPEIAAKVQKRAVKVQKQDKNSKKPNFTVYDELKHQCCCFS